jgi:hypothetical protein
MFQAVAFLQEQEVPMKLFLSKLEVVGIIVAVSFSFSAQAAEKKHITYSAKAQQILSQTTVNPGDVPNHELVQRVRIDTSTSADPDWKDLEWLSYDQADSVAENGTHRGYRAIPIIGTENRSKQAILPQRTGHSDLTEAEAVHGRSAPPR